MRELVARGEVVAIELRSADGQVVARAGPVDAVAPRGAPIAVGGQTVGDLSVSQTEAAELLARVKELTGLELVLFRDGEPLASSVDGALGAPGPRPARRAQRHRGGGCGLPGPGGADRGAGESARRHRPPARLC